MSSFFPFFFQLSRLLKELKETKEAQSPEVKLLCSLEAKLLTMELRQQDREKELNKVDWVETWNEAHHHGPNWCWNVAFVIRWGELFFSKSYLMDRLTRKIKYTVFQLWGWSNQDKTPSQNVSYRSLEVRGLRVISSHKSIIGGASQWIRSESWKLSAWSWTPFWIS